MQKAHWNPLFVDDALLHGVELAAVRIGEAFDRDDLLATHRMRQHRTRIARHVVDEDGAPRRTRRDSPAELGCR
jgi:hypothetical protein